jgi:hypothetical protein
MGQDVTGLFTSFRRPTTSTPVVNKTAVQKTERDKGSPHLLEQARLPHA